MVRKLKLRCIFMLAWHHRPMRRKKKNWCDHAKVKRVVYFWPFCMITGQSEEREKIFLQCWTGVFLFFMRYHRFVMKKDNSCCDVAPMYFHVCASSQAFCAGGGFMLWWRTDQLCCVFFVSVLVFSGNCDKTWELNIYCQKFFWGFFHVT